MTISGSSRHATLLTVRLSISLAFPAIRSSRSNPPSGPLRIVERVHPTDEPDPALLVSDGSAFARLQSPSTFGRLSPDTSPGSSDPPALALSQNPQKPSSPSSRQPVRQQCWREE